MSAINYSQKGKQNMSTVNSVAASSYANFGARQKPVSSQTTSSQPQAATASGTSISSGGAAYANYLRMIEQQESGRTLRQMALEDPNNPKWAKSNDIDVNENMLAGDIGGAISLAGTTPNDPIKYTCGDPVTAASQAYYEKQAAIYMSQLGELVSTEKAKGTAPGQIFAAICDLQAKQPDAFRAIMMWTPAAEPFSIEKASNPSGAPQQFLNAGGQVVKT